MSDKLAVTVDAEPIDVVINIKVSGDLPDNGKDGQVLMRVGGKNVWADPPAGPGGGIAKEIDPTVPAWAKQPNKPKYTAEEVGAASKGDVEQLSEAVADKQPKGDYALRSEIPKVPEPYTLPVASADTLGGVKVGAGLQMTGDVLSTVEGHEGVYELIEEIELEEAVREIRCDGYNLSKVYVELTVPNTGSNAAGVVSINDRHAVYAARMRGTETDSAITKCVARVENGMLMCSGYSARNEPFVQTAILPVYRDAFAGLMLEEITSVAVWMAEGSERLPVGTKLIIKGVQRNA